MYVHLLTQITQHNRSESYAEQDCWQRLRDKEIKGDLGWAQPRTLHESRLTLSWGSAGPQPLRVSRSLAMAEFSVKIFALFLW